AGTRALRRRLASPQSLWPSIGGYRSANRQALGQLPADPFGGGLDPLGDADVANLGRPIVATLIVVANRVSLPTRSGARAGGLEVALQGVFKDHPGIWFGWSGKVVPQDKVETRTVGDTNPQFV